MTEEEAKGKWCPVLGIAGAMFGAAGRNEQAQKNCIGSACAMWRWVVPSQETVNEARALGFEPRLKSHGYCGLAGKP